MFNPGDKFDKYTIVRRIGSGGMGDVFLAKNVFDADVVLKALHPDFATNPDVIERFHREGRIQYTLRHPNIVRVTDIVEREGRYALVVDFMRGRDLEARLNATGPLRAEEIVKVATKMLDALQTAHDHGYIHRDLKPANIFLEEVEGGGWEPRLMDFGIAKIQEAGALTRAQEFCGTPCYASPEQIASTKDVSPLTDVYSFGVVMWSMCTGHEPYREHADDPYAVLASVVRKELPPLPDEVPGWLKEIIGRATLKDMSKRYASAGAFRDALIAAARENQLGQTVAGFKHQIVVTQRAFASADTAVAVDAPAVTRPEPQPFPAVSAVQSGRARPAGDAPASGADRPARSSQSGMRPLPDHPADPRLELERNAPIDRELVPTSSRKATAAEMERARAVEESFGRGGRGLSRRALRRAIAAGAAIAVAGGVAAAGYLSLASRPLAAPAGFVRIEPGTFEMGSPPDEPGRGRDEAAHTVTITRPFALMAYEVTQREWADVMMSAPDSFEDCGPECPMVEVSWTEAARLANRRSLLEGLRSCYVISAEGDVQWPQGLDCEGYRLPTEAEWEYAARAGAASAFFSGHLEQTGRAMLDPRLSVIGWYAANANATYGSAVDCASWGEGRAKCGPQPVGTRRASDWGLYDTSGNVAEWVWDVYGPYPDGGVTDPLGAQSGGQRVVRGGSWRDTAERCRSAARDKNANARRMFIGVRLARTLR